MTSELVPPLLTTTLHQREDVSALDRFTVHRCPTRQIMFDPSSFADPTPLAHADASRDVLPRRETSQR
ncbi:hypothetical protein TNCV_790511 [Trichonephila clavipes]|nr:hypothetical protein TNCV_790511 [Trichonephila clavipes]